MITQIGTSYAQYQGMGGQGYQGMGGSQQNQIPRTPVNGTYSNSGLQITLPDGLSGFEMKRPSGTTYVTAFPGGMPSTTGQRPPVVMTILMEPKSTTSQGNGRNMASCSNLPQHTHNM